MKLTKLVSSVSHKEFRNIEKAIEFKHNAHILIHISFKFFDIFHLPKKKRSLNSNSKFERILYSINRRNQPKSERREYSYFTFHHESSLKLCFYCQNILRSVRKF